MLTLDKIAATDLIKSLSIGFKVKEFPVPSELSSEQPMVEAAIYTPQEQIDGHWLIRLHFGSFQSRDPVHDQVIGVTSHKDQIPYKTYDCALAYATNLVREKSKTLDNRTPTSARQSPKSAQVPANLDVYG